MKKNKAFISKIEILKVPYLSDWMKLMQCTFLDRKNMRQSVQAMQQAIETVKKGYSLVIFPEGTRSR
ncbi:MAG TPA: lysophospholipid acyltransferase family protein, partial [Treponemataceae bacterium]|nr:lysophospholipid acyltransferase family protein [Treponemataceae bacterium]